MKRLNVLLVCGSGASTSFLANSMRKAAIGLEVDLDVNARSETEVEAYMEEVDCVVLGPHLAYLQNEMNERVKDSKAKVIVADKNYYSVLDGKAAIQDILKHLN